MKKEKAILHYQERVEAHYLQLELENDPGDAVVNADMELFLSELRQLMEESANTLHRAA